APHSFPSHFFPQPPRPPPPTPLFPYTTLFRSRAGVNLAWIRTWCFVLCAFTAGIGGLLYASYLGGMSNNFNGGQIVLYAIAAARSEEHTSELQSPYDIVCRLLLEKKK